jgi:diguanylate cyclase (GGDEF)-like protein
LNNRRTFFEMVEKARARKNRGILLMLDADWFKKINDTHGHQVGDRCLTTIAYTLRRNIRQNDILGRLGGEEFAIYLQDATIEQARVIGERLTKPITFDSDAQQGLTVTLSIGAVISEPQLSIDALVAQADAALYQAKESGRATVRFWDAIAEHGKQGQPAQGT